MDGLVITHRVEIVGRDVRHITHVVGRESDFRLFVGGVGGEDFWGFDFGGEDWGFGFSSFGEEKKLLYPPTL